MSDLRAKSIRSAEPSDEASSDGARPAPLIRIENVSKVYTLGNEQVTALHDVSLSIDAGVFLAIAGPSGSGKTTLLNLIGCIDQPTTGRIWLDGSDVTSKSSNELADLRARSIGFIFQTFNLLPVLSAAENIEYPLLHVKELPKDARRSRVAKYLEIVGLRDFARHRPDQLSGGQRQRVAIARALAINPRIVLADEPTANLDHRTGKSILRLMKRINRTTSTTFVFSTHDQKVIDMADRLINIEDGVVRRLGVRQERKWTYVSIAANASLSRERRDGERSLRSGSSGRPDPSKDVPR